MAASFGLTDVFSRTFTAAEAINAFDAVTLTSAGTVDRADGATDNVIGFASRAAAAGEEVAVRLVGAPSQNATSQSTVAIGALLYPTSTPGQVGTSGTPGTNPCLGVAVTAATGGGQTIVLLTTRSV
jgi:hypothetical protein